MNLNANGEPGLACPSRLQLDRLFAEELSDLERARLERHVAGCATCQHALAECAEDQARFVPEPALLVLLAARQGGGPAEATPLRRLRPSTQPAPWSRRWARPVAALATALAAAAILLLLLRPRPPGSRELVPGTTKGGFATVVSERGGLRRELGEGSSVQPGDRLQVYVRLSDPRFVAVYSRDGGGQLSRYAPTEAAMIALPAGVHELPNSTILDEVVGDELLAVFACARPASDAALRAHVAEGAPAGCEVARVALHKQAPGALEAAP